MLTPEVIFTTHQLSRGIHAIPPVEDFLQSNKTRKSMTPLHLKATTIPVCRREEEEEEQVDLALQAAPRLEIYEIMA